MGRQEQKARTRQRVVDAARAQFREVGFDGATVARIAREAGVATGTVMAHFPDKDALVAAAFHADLEAVLERAWATAPDTPPRAVMLHLAGHLYRWYAQDPALSQALVQRSLFLDASPEERFGAQVGQFVARVAERIDQAGDLAPGTDPMLLAEGWFHDYFGVLIAGLRGRWASTEAQLAHLERLLARREG